MLTKGFMDRVLPLYGQVRRALPFLFPRPLGFFFYLTGRCNLRCTYCWQREDEARKEGWADATRNELSPTEWARVVEQLPRPCFLGLSGGESTLSPAFAAVLDRAAQRRIPVTVNTNAAALGQEVLERLARPPVRNVSVSLDGFATVHDQSRGIAGLFGRVTDGIRKLNALRRDRRPALTIKTVLLDENLDSLPEFWEFCSKELKADTLNISFMKTGDHAQYALKHCPDLEGILGRRHAELHGYRDPERVADVLGALLKRAGSSSCPVVLYPQMSTRAQIHAFLAQRGEGPYEPCRLPWALSVVLPDGEVVPCLSLALGNVREHGYNPSRILRGSRAKDFYRTLGTWGSNTPAACRVCCFLRVERRSRPCAEAGRPLSAGESK